MLTIVIRRSPVLNLNDFKNTVSVGEKPKGLTSALGALWAAAAGDWETAHQIVQESEDRGCAWVHAYLHLKEGDDSNAGYWYRRAGRDACEESLDEEWDDITKTLLEEA